MFRTGPMGSTGSEPTQTRVYGPVPSRRLGRSLGVDLVPFKTCTYDCVYCQLGRTTRKTLERAAFCDVRALAGEVRDRVQRSRPDYVTLAGSGEPTLEARFGDLIEEIKTGTDVPVVLLTNGSLLWDEEVWRAAALADAVLPSLDAGDEAFFQWVNRPVEGLSFDRVLSGLIAFRERYAGPIWLEVMVLAGKTDAAGRLEAIADAAAKIRPDCIHLNTPIRPGGAPDALTLERGRLERLRNRFAPCADVVCEFSGHPPQDDPEAAEDALTIMALLRRRPCTLNEIVAGLGIRCGTVRRVLEDYQREEAIRRFRREGRLYYAAAEPAEPDS